MALGAWIASALNDAVTWRLRRRRGRDRRRLKEQTETFQTTPASPSEASATPTHGHAFPEENMKAKCSTCFGWSLGGRVEFFQRLSFRRSFQRLPVGSPLERARANVARAASVSALERAWRHARPGHGHCHLLRQVAQSGSTHCAAAMDTNNIALEISNCRY